VNEIILLDLGKLKLANSTVYNVVNRYNNTGEIKLPTRSGRPQLLNVREMCHLLHIVKKRP
ncbi:16249_t:CDS:1, partial [Funneliformis mosseae]